jgi:hypothetical protein
MKAEGEECQSSAFDDRSGVRNPFGVMDVPRPDDQEEVAAFAAAAMVDGSASDENAVCMEHRGRAGPARRNRRKPPRRARL